MGWLELLVGTMISHADWAWQSSHHSSDMHGWQWLVARYIGAIDNVTAMQDGGVGRAIEARQRLGRGCAPKS